MCWIELPIDSDSFGTSCICFIFGSLTSTVFDFNAVFEWFLLETRVQQTEMYDIYMNGNINFELKTRLT